jgi:hypothetical protein
VDFTLLLVVFLTLAGFLVAALLEAVAFLVFNVKTPLAIQKLSVLLYHCFFKFDAFARDSIHLAKGKSVGDFIKQACQT